MLLRKITIIFFLILTVFSFGQCKTAEKGNEDIIKPIPLIAKNSDVSKLNKDRTMLLSIRKTIKRSDPAIYFNYTVYNTKTKEIIKQGAFRGLSIDWHDNTSLKLVPYIGMEQKPTSDNPEDALASSKNTHTQITIIKLNN